MIGNIQTASDAKNPAGNLVLKQAKVKLLKVQISREYRVRFVLLALIYFSVLGCSTVHTISNSDDGLVMKGSYCKSIDHVFSGVQYNICKLHGTPNPNATEISTRGSMEYIGIDTAFSFISDIAVLPYTVYKQASSDPISVRSSQK